MKQRMIAIYILLGVTAAMLASATYAWYTISQAVTIELVEVSVSSTKNLEISSGRVSGDGKILLPDLLVKTGLCPSKGEARRLIQQGGVTINEEKVTDFAASYPASAFETEFIVKRKHFLD